MIGVIYSIPTDERLVPFHEEPLGQRVIVGETIFKRLERQLLAAGVEKVLYVGSCDGCITKDALGEYLDQGDLVLYVSDRLFISEGFVEVIKDLINRGEEVSLVSTNVKTERMIKSNVGYVYSLGVYVCKRPKFFEPCGMISFVSSPRVTTIHETHDLLKALDIALSDIKETRISNKAKIHSDVILDGPVIVDDGAEIYERTKIVGPAYIGKNTIIGNSSLIRRSSINSATVGFSCEIKHSVIEPGAHAGRLSYIGDSYIGHDTTIVGGIMTINYKPGMPKRGAFIGPRKRIIGFRTFEYNSRV